MPAIINEDLVGVSVVNVKNVPTLRLAFRPHHLKSIGTPKRVDVRGSTRDGLLIAPGKMYTPYKVSNNLFYLQMVLSSFEARLKDTPRATIWMRPDIKNGHLQLPCMPEAWVNADDDFLRTTVNGSEAHIYEPGPVQSQLSPFPGDPAAPIKAAEAVEVLPPVRNGNGHHHSATVPLPKPQLPVYQVPGSMRDMEAVLGAKIDEVRAILRAMEEKTGLQFVLDRNLRVVVNLRPRENK